MKHLCLNPFCPQPENSVDRLFCSACGSELLLDGRYRVLQLLSDKTGFGKIYEVQEKKTGTAKILKVLVRSEQKAIDLFQQEAQILMRLNHPGIPQGDAYFTFQPRQRPEVLHCLVMQKIKGSNLEDYIQERGRPIAQRTALGWLQEITEILQVVHQQQFFHRDIKPGNVMLTPEGNLVLIDFGTAREISSTYYQKLAAGRNITGIGSVGYTPPEQMNGQAEPRSDFFALGRTFVYLLTGQYPNELYNPNTDEVEWRSHAQIDPRFADLLDRLMARLPANRPLDPPSILQSLSVLTQQLYLPPTPPAPPASLRATPTSRLSWSRRRVIKTLGWTGAGLGAAIVGRQFLQQSAPPSNPQPPDSLPTFPQPNPRVIQTLATQTLVLAGVLGAAIVGRQFLQQSAPSSNPWRSNPSSNPQQADSLSLQSFSFETVRVDGRGNIVEKKLGQAQFFTENLGDDVTLEMVKIPGGTFQMGSLKGKGRSPNESPQHRVTVPEFYLGKYAVTQAQYKAIVGSNPSSFKGDRRPVEQVSWNDAAEFCRRLSQKTGRQYRLPSEAEWEYACRAGTTTPFYFGETITSRLAQYDNLNRPYREEPQGFHSLFKLFKLFTTEVGTFPPNAFGLYDMHGNVWEWCQDTYHDSYKDAPRDGSAWLTQNGNADRVRRGGSWAHNPRNCRSAYRNADSPVNPSPYIGFRVVCVSPKTL